MRIFRLAQLFEQKYQIKSLASTQILNSFKRDIVDAYNHYVNSDKAKEPVLQMLANIKEPFSVKLVSSMEDIVANLDTYSVQQLFTKINNVLGLIQAAREDPNNTVRNFIHDSIRVNKESERNFREHLKSKFEMVVFKRLSSILEKQAKILQKILLSETPIKGHALEPIRKELSKQKILNFLRTPVADKYGLDSLDTWEKVSSYPDLRDKLTTLINAIDRGHYPIDGPEIQQAVAEIMEKFRDRVAKDNSTIFGEGDQ